MVPCPSRDAKVLSTDAYDFLLCVLLSYAVNENFIFSFFRYGSWSCPSMFSEESGRDDIVESRDEREVARMLKKQ